MSATAGTPASSRSTTLEVLDPEGHAATVHAWVTHPRSRFWGMAEASLAAVADDYRAIADHPHHHAWLGRVGGEPAFLAETYDPRLATAVGLGDLPELRPGDLGMHLLVAPPEPGTAPRHGHTRGIFRAVMEHCFADPEVRRVVVEPDVRNRPIAVLNAEFGFVVSRVVALPGKDAALSFCTRTAFEEALS